MITTLNRGSLSELHSAIVELENRGYQVIAPTSEENIHAWLVRNGHV